MKQIKQFNDWFNTKFGWFFINGRKQIQSHSHTHKQEEISDDMIEAAAHEHINYGGGAEGYIKDAFKKGAKWYKEQSKK